MTGQAVNSQVMTPASWMTDATVTKVFGALGYPDVDVRFVGGCVRDAILERTISDIDIATPDLPDVVADKLVHAGLKVVPTGLSHGTVTAVADNRGFEITTLRKDTACDGRHASVEFTTDWVEDASRRDFTFNALSLRPNGDLFDPFDGVADAQAGVVRFVGNPQDRIQEDYLRILRYFRFLAHYGKAAPQSDVLTTCTALKSGLAQLSAERVRTELTKLLQAERPLVAIDAMVETGILSQIATADVELNTLSVLLDLEARADVGQPVDWLGRWVALFAQESEPLSRRLKCSGKEQKRIANLVAAAERSGDSFVTPARYYYLHDFEPAVGAVGALIAWARRGETTGTQWLELYAEAGARSPRVFPLSGADVRAAGVEEGPDVGGILATLEKEWIESGFTLPVGDLKTRLRTLADKTDPTKK